MAIKEIKHPQFFSDLTGCYYDTYKEACKAEFRELLVQALDSDTPVGLQMSSGACCDLASWFADRYPELWAPKASLEQVMNRVYAANHGMSSIEFERVIKCLLDGYDVTIREKK